MVIVVDLDEDGEPAIPSEAIVHQKHVLESTKDLRISDTNTAASLLAAILQCYPVVSVVASHLDLNSLHDLAATSRQIHTALVPNRKQLVKQTLRCVNDDFHQCAKDAQDAWDGDRNQGLYRKLTTGRIGVCARDLVGRCRRCDMTVCRNCTIKPPAKIALRGRHRRLCKTCIKAPLVYHTHDLDVTGSPSFTSEAFCKGACNCEDIVWLCISCGSALRSSDTTYMRGWTWRTRYSCYLGGLGTGIGEGNEGVECGKGDQCLAAREIEKEIDCNADELADIKHQIEDASRHGHQWGGTSYLTQEIEGIGGVVKKKVKKRVRVGAVVKEYEDERETGHYLEREQSSSSRSFCFWCLRVIAGAKDRRPTSLARSLTDVSSSSSIGESSE